MRPSVNLLSNNKCNGFQFSKKKITSHIPINSHLKFVQEVIEELSIEHLDAKTNVGHVIQQSRAVAIVVVRHIAG